MTDLVLPVVPQGTAIPRVIHQTYPTIALPPDLAANVAHLRESNPGWEHRLYDDAAIFTFIAREYGEAMFAQLDRIAPRYGAARADLFRYLLMYREGGVYLDIKSTTTRPLDATVRPDDRYLLSHWSPDRQGWGQHASLAHVPGGEFQQWHIVCAPGHPYLRAVIAEVLARIDAYRPWRTGVGQAGVLATTGPIAYTAAIFPILRDHPHREVATEADIGLRYSIVADFKHQQLMPRHYTAVVAPLIARGGVAGRADRGYTRLLRWKNAVAIATYPMRRSLRDRLARRDR